MASSRPASAPVAHDPGLDYLAALRAGFGRAVEAVGGAVERDLAIGGLRLRLRFAGEAMGAVLLAPFEHLQIAADEEVGLRIDVFDTASTGIEPPPLPWEPVEAAAGTNPVLRFESDRVCLLAAAGTGALTAVERSRGEAVFHLPDASAVPPSERAAPLREALQVLMAPCERWLTHAAAVGRRGRGALLVGAGGSGKSTLALSCALAGMEIAADDYVLLETGPAVAHSMQSTAKLTADSFARLGLDSTFLGPNGFEPSLEGAAKALVDIRSLAPGLLRRRLDVGVLVAPTVAGSARPELRSLSRPQALRRLAPSTVLQSAARTPPLLGALVELVREVPAYELLLCPSADANADAVGGLVRGLG